MIKRFTQKFDLYIDHTRLIILNYKLFKRLKIVEYHDAFAILTISRKLQKE